MKDLDVAITRVHGGDLLYAALLGSPRWHRGHGSVQGHQGRAGCRNQADQAAAAESDHAQHPAGGNGERCCHPHAAKTVFGAFAILETNSRRYLIASSCLMGICSVLEAR